jgi:hypothetical protein
MSAIVFHENDVEVQRAGTISMTLSITASLSGAQQSRRIPWNNFWDQHTPRRLRRLRCSLSTPGMTVISCFRAQNYLHGYWQVVGPPIRHASLGVTLKSGSHPDSADACVVRALDVDLTVAD